MAHSVRPLVRRYVEAWEEQLWSAVTSKRGKPLRRSVGSRYVEAWEAVDIDRLVGLLRSDAILTMPPFPLRYRGRSAIAEFFATVPAGGALDQIRLMPTRANRQPAVAAYALDPASQKHRAYGLMVLAIDGGEIAEVTGFADPTLFSVFGLPAELEAQMAYAG